MRRKLVTVTLCIAVLVVIGVIMAAPMFIHNMVKKRTTRHTFEIENVPRFLTEEMAIAFARKTLRLEGFNEATWELCEQEQVWTVDPDGRTDKYSSRNSLNPNDVSMIFRNKADGHVRCVDVEMENNRVVCAVTIPK